MKFGNSPKSKNPLRTATTAALLGLCASSLGDCFFSYSNSAYAEGVKKERTLTDLELSRSQRNLLAKAAKSLAELGLREDSFKLLNILERTDDLGRYTRDNLRLENQLESRLERSKTPKRKNNPKVRSVRSNLQKFAESLFEEVESKETPIQKEALKILGELDTSSSEFEKLSAILKSKGVIYLWDNSVATNLKKVQYLNFEQNITTGNTAEPQEYFDSSKSVEFASYADKDGNKLSIKSTVLKQEELSLLLTKALEATVMLEGLGFQNWNLPTVDQLSLVLLGSKESPAAPVNADPGLLLTVNNQNVGAVPGELTTRFFRIDSSNRGSPRLQANMLVSDLLGRGLQGERFKGLPFFAKVGLMDLVSRELTSLNAGAVSEIRKALVPGTTRGISFKWTEGFGALMFSGPISEINHIELDAIASPKISLSKMLGSSKLLKQKEGRLAAVRYVQYLSERGLLGEFLLQAEEKKPASSTDYESILTSSSGKTIPELESDFKAWAKGLTSDQEGDASGFMVGREGILQRLEAWSNREEGQEARKTLEDVTKQTKEMLSILLEERAAYFGVDLPLAVSPLLCEGARMHVDYMLKTPEKDPGHHQDPKLDMFARLGAYSGQNGLVSFRPRGESETLEMAIESHLSTVYHRIAPLDSRATAIGGFANEHMSVISIYIDPSSKVPDAVKGKTLCYPPNGAKNVPIEYGGGRVEDPHPAPGAIGFPITVDFQKTVENSKIRLFKSNPKGEDIEIKGIFLTFETDPHKFLSEMDTRIPIVKLEKNTNYYYIVEGDEFETRKVEFSTGSR